VLSFAGVSMPNVQTWKAIRVLPKTDKGLPMSPAALVADTRSMATELVRREERRVGSRAVAYEIVAQTVGISSSWLRKFVSERSEVKEPRITLFQNIRVAYDNLCERVELENRNDELRLRLLKDRTNAAIESLPTQDNQ